MNNEFSPKIGIAKRYSIENMAASKGLSIEKLKIKNAIIQECIDKDYTQEQAETTALRILYIPGFGGGTFKD